MATRLSHSRPDLSGTLALAFANTLRAPGSAAPDALATPSDVVRWVSENVAAGGNAAPPGPLWGPPVSRQLHTEALRLRDAIQRLLSLVTAHQPPTGAVLDEINRVVDAATWSRRIAIEGDGLRLHETTFARRPEGILAPVAWAAAQFAITADPGRLRRCAAEDCSQWFVDTSKGGRRRWCSMATCGNRAKAARWRDRHSS